MMDQSSTRYFGVSPDKIQVFIETALSQLFHSEPVLLPIFFFRKKNNLATSHCGWEQIYCWIQNDEIILMTAK